MARHPKNRNRPVAAQAQPKFNKVNGNAAGIDCGSDEHYVAVPADRDPEPGRRFGALTADLIPLAQWLLACRLHTVALESTGLHWLPPYENLEQHGLEVKVAD